MATEKYCNEVPLKDGVKEFLEYLKDSRSRLRFVQATVLN